MAKKLFVGSLPFSINEEELKELFQGFGNVISSRIIVDKETRRSRGFGFVEMENDDEALAAISAMDGSSIGGRTVVVNEAKEPERSSRPPRR